MSAVSADRRKRRGRGEYVDEEGPGEEFRGPARVEVLLLEPPVLHTARVRGGQSERAREGEQEIGR